MFLHFLLLILAVGFKQRKDNSKPTPVPVFQLAHDYADCGADAFLYDFFVPLHRIMGHFQIFILNSILMFFL